MEINPFQYGFFVKAFIAALVLGAVLPLLGVFLILRRFSLLPDSLAHVALAGISLGTLLRFLPIYVGLAVTMVLAYLIEDLRLKGKLPSDLILALFLYGSLALALIIFSVTNSFGSTILEYLLGNIIGISTADLVLLLVIMAVLLLFIVVFQREMAQLALDEQLARINGVRVGMISRLYSVVAGASIIAAMLAVGVLLVGALTVIPGLIALRVARRGTIRVLMVASLAGAFTGVAGLLASYYFDVSPSGAIVLTGMLLLLAVEAVMLVRNRFIRGDLSAATPELIGAEGGGGDGGESNSPSRRSHA